MVVVPRQRVDSTPKGKAGEGADQCEVVVPIDSDAVKSPEDESKEKDEREESDPASRPGRRRRSSRIQTKQRAEKELLAKRRAELLDEEEEGRVKKRVNVRKRVAVDVNEAVPKEDKQTLSESTDGERDNAACGKSDYVKTKETLCERVLGGSLEVENGAPSSGADVPHVAEKSDYAKVKETLRSFNKHYLHFVQVNCYKPSSNIFFSVTSFCADSSCVHLEWLIMLLIY